MQTSLNKYLLLLVAVSVLKQVNCKTIKDRLK